MKVVILCGGKGTRLKEMTGEVPKALIEIGGKPILWHIMKIYSHYGFKDFILCLGYKGSKIKEYFMKRDWRDANFSIKGGKLEIHTPNVEDWNITFVDTGENATKSERLLKVRAYLDSDEDFFVSYGDDISNVDIPKSLEFHKKSNKIATLTAARPENPFGVIGLDGDLIVDFKEKPLMENWVNGGFYIFNKKIFDELEQIKEGEELETEVLKRLTEKREISAFRHEGFWKAMNTHKDVDELNELWKNQNALWKVWN